jgi:hypothetical protein
MNNLEFNYRTMILAPVEANITRQLNNPVYSLDFVVVILDRVSMNSDIDSVMSIEENIFVLGQLQDYLIQIGHDVEFDSIDLYSSMMDDYNVTSATASFTINIARKPYINGLNIN